MPCTSVHPIFVVDSQIKGIENQPSCVTLTRIGIPRNGAAKGTHTIVITQINAITRRVHAKFLSFKPCCLAWSTIFAFWFMAYNIISCCLAFAFANWPSKVVTKPSKDPPKRVAINSILFRSISHLEIVHQFLHLLP